VEDPDFWGGGPNCISARGGGKKKKSYGLIMFFLWGGRGIGSVRLIHKGEKEKRKGEVDFDSGGRAQKRASRYSMERKKKREGRNIVKEKDKGRKKPKG